MVKIKVDGKKGKVKILGQSSKITEELALATAVIVIRLAVEGREEELADIINKTVKDTIKVRLRGEENG